MNLGIRAHDIENKDLEDLTQKLTEKNLYTVQFALKKSIKEWEITTSSLNTGLARKISRQLNEKSINISVLGCYINMIHPNPEERKKALDYFKAHIRFARDFECSIVGTETGGVLEEIVYTKENYSEEAYQKVVTSVKELVLEAEKFGVIVGIEGGINHPIYSPKMMKRLIDDVDSNNLQIIFDPVNYLTLENYQEQKKIMDEAFELFGDRIIIIHAKDFVVNQNKIEFVPVGKGKLDYLHLFNKIKFSKPCIPILMEDTQEPHIDHGTAYLTKIYQSIEEDNNGNN